MKRTIQRRGEKQRPKQRSNYQREPYSKIKRRQDLYPEHHVVQINRRQVCPFLVRIFYAINDQNEYKKIDELPTREIKLHLWMNSTLKEIVELLRAYLPSLRTKQRYVFSRVRQDIVKKQLIKIQAGTILVNRRYDKTEERKLMDLNYCIGDYIDISINYK